MGRAGLRAEGGRRGAREEDNALPAGHPLRARELVSSEMVTVGAAKGLHGQFYEAEVSDVLFRDVKGKVEVLVDDILTAEGL